MREALKTIYDEDQSIKQVFTTERPAFNNFLSNYRFAQKNGFVINNLNKFSEKNIQKNFAILCLNNPRFAVGNLNLEDDKECIESYKKNNFILIKTTKIDDFMIHFIEYNKQIK